MKDEAVVKRYAEAFVGFAKETIGLDRAMEDLKALKGIMRDNPGFKEVLESPQISLLEKHNFLDQIMGGDFSKEFIQFLNLLLEKRRFDKILNIADYIRVNYAYKGEVEAVLRTSLPLDLELIQDIKDKLEERIAKKLKFYIDLDGNLLGGVQVVMGNTLIDGSVRGRLDELKEKLKAVKV